MRRYWDGTTEQSKPRAAPKLWPYLDHRDMAEVMAAEKVRPAWRERQRLERKKP